LKELIKSVSKLSIPTGLNFFSSILRNKIIALVTGPIGLGIYSQFINLSILTTAILPVGSLGLMTYISRYYEDKRLDEISSMVKYFFKRNLLISFIIVFSLLILRNYFSTLIFASPNLSPLLILFSFTIPLNLILNFVDIYLRGIRMINKYALFLSINSLIFTLVSVPLVYFWGINGAIAAMVLSTIISLLTSFLLLKKNNLILKFGKNTLVEKTAINNIYFLGLGALVTLAAQQVTMLAIKSTLASELGLGKVGEFQCVYSISAGYFGVFFSLIATYSIPKVSALKDRIMIIDELNSTLKFLVIIFTPLIILMFSMRTLVIQILYSSEFLNAKELLIYQLPAEFVRALSWVTGLWLIPGLKIKQWIIFDSIFYFLFFILFYILLMYFGLGIKAASISYLVSYLTLFTMYFLYSVRIINFKFNKGNLKLLFLSIIFLLLGFSISFINEYIGFYFILPILLGWTVVVFQKDDIEKIKAIIQNKFLK
jgi:PST family polysaccharide transporter